ncbi:MAG: aspartate-semialdehyde dehydrogenase [Alphaproteobacteria bacterium]|nr:aspartate-semialdehyde dehydrogenase [Alphaproteobacteria bacterium]
MVNVAVVGATGNVGRTMLDILAERKFPVDKIYALASPKSVGKELSFGDDVVVVEDLAKFDFSKADVALMSAGGSVSEKWAPKMAEAGCVVIDNSSQWRMDPDVPLVVPEVNPQAIAGYKKKGIIANPNCSTIQMVVPLAALHRKFKIKRVVVSTYQSVSGAGKAGIDELWDQSKLVYEGSIGLDRMGETVKKFTKQISYNVIPHIDVFLDDGATKEEWKMAAETKKILDPSIKLHANCARVPVFVGHGEYVNIECENEISDQAARTILMKTPGVMVVDNRVDAGYQTQVDAAGLDDVYVSRIRSDATVDNGLSFWCVADNLRKGAALNAVQIAEVLVRDYLNK